MNPFKIEVPAPYKSLQYEEDGDSDRAWIAVEDE